MFKNFSKINSNILCLAFFACTFCFVGYTNVPAPYGPVQTELRYEDHTIKQAVAGFYFNTVSNGFLWPCVSFSFRTLQASEGERIQVLVIHQNKLFLNYIFSKIAYYTFKYHSSGKVDLTSFS